MTTVFLDRDGVINENRTDYVKSWDEFCFLPGSLDAIARLTQAGYRIVVCTNQAAIARGLTTLDIVEDIHRRMQNAVVAAGGYIEKVYYCPHNPAECCTCRKPRPGLLLRARDELGLDLTGAVFVGDSIADVQAGFAAGIQSILVLTGLGGTQLHDRLLEVEHPFLVTGNLMHAVEAILQGSYISSYASCNVS